jgi:hypothetical protein
VYIHGTNNHPVTSRRTHQTENTKTETTTIQSPEINKLKQQQSSRQKSNQKNKKKNNSSVIKPKQQKLSRPLDHSLEIIKPKQQKPKIRFKIWPVLRSLLASSKLQRIRERDQHKRERVREIEREYLWLMEIRGRRA